MLAGAAFGLSGANPWPKFTGRVAHFLLQGSIIAMGTTLHLGEILRAGGGGIAITLGTILATLTLGHWLGRAFGVSRDATLLVSGGTAICGGSAIAALAGALRPRTHDVTVAMGTVFLLNAIALAIFPTLGHWFGLTQPQFGWWAALAIHDTSSVIGAGLAYGSSALALATTIKLARAVWIAPLTLGVSAFRRRDAAADKTTQGRPHFPWFILGFVALAALFTLFPNWAAAGARVSHIAQRLIVLTLFCIGASFTRPALRTVGIRPLLLGTTLWLIVASASLVVIKGVIAE